MNEQAPDFPNPGKDSLSAQRLPCASSGGEGMQSEAPQTIVGVPSNRLSPLWLVCLGLGLVADLLAAIGGELTCAGGFIGGVSGALVGAELSVLLVPVFFDVSNSQTLRGNRIVPS
jgi:hypothetical protein